MWTCICQSKSDSAKGWKLSNTREVNVRLFNTILTESLFIVFRFWCAIAIFGRYWHSKTGLLDDHPFRSLNISLWIFACMDQVHVVKVILCFTNSKISIFREIWIAFFLLFHFSPTCPVEMNKPPENMHQNIALQDTIRLGSCPHIKAAWGNPVESTGSQMKELMKASGKPHSHSST